jgi:phospholipase C
VFDHTSTLQFLEKFLSHKTGKKVVEPNISNWRRTVCGDLSTTFRPYNGESIPNPEFVAREVFLEGIHKAQFKKLPSDYKLLTAEEIALINKNPHASPYMPQQEKGIKPSSALPYQLYADGKLSADKKSFQIKFNASKQLFGDKALGSPFNVYAPGNYASFNNPEKMEPLRTWAYALTAGDSLADAWPLHEFENGEYHLRVYGPNGFYREYKGNAADPLIDVACDYQAS